MNAPVLWSFRRCPYAMRARLAVLSAGLRVELREILLRDKPDAFLKVSPSATVPALELPEIALDESLDIMIWALKQSDPNALLDMPAEGWDLIERFDGPFKDALDHTKYAVRYPELDAEAERRKAADHLLSLEGRLARHPWLFGERETVADLAILPFVRQFAHIDRAWFDAQPWPNVIRWLDTFLNSQRFKTVMEKRAVWDDGDEPVWFGEPAVQS